MIALPWKRHLSDERLLDCYLADCGGEGIEPRAAEHLADCPSCDDRYAELAGVLNDVRMAAEDEVDQVFTPERLKAQQQAIDERLRMLGHAGRIISFPAHLEKQPMAARGPVTGLSRVAAGWVAAAAAAGIFIGVSVGRIYETTAHRRAEAVNSQPTPAPVQTPAPVRVESPALDDDSLLMSELEAMRDRPRTAELLAFEALTPHTREIRYRTP